MDKEIPVLNYGFVRLDAFMGGDLSVVNSARVSFGKRVKFLSDSDKGLINFLMRERHGTPFESSVFTFHVKCPIFVAREWFRHRIGSFNEMSGRYTELLNQFYIPSYGSVRTQVGKPGRYKFEKVDKNIAELFVDDLLKTYKECWDCYQRALSNGVAKELARIILPVGIFTEFYWTVNARSLMNFLELRNADTAQMEIHEYAKVVESTYENLMPISHKSFLDNGHKAP